VGGAVVVGVGRLDVVAVLDVGLADGGHTRWSCGRGKRVGP
jgi:hypothetical protein